MLWRQHGGDGGSKVTGLEVEWDGLVTTSCRRDARRKAVDLDTSMRDNGRGMLVCMSELLVVLAVVRAAVGEEPLGDRVACRRVLSSVSVKGS